MSLKSTLLGIDTVEELSKQLDLLRGQLHQETCECDTLHAVVELRERYKPLWDGFRQHFIAARRSDVAHAIAAMPQGQENEPERLRLAGRYDELTDMMKTDFQNDAAYHAALSRKKDTLDKIVGVEKAIANARRREERAI